MVSTDGPGVQHQSQNFTSVDARAGGFLAVPLKAIRELGPAAQTLAGILSALRTDGKKTFRHQPSLARAAMLPVRTFRRHLAELERVGLVESTREPNNTNVTKVSCDEAEFMADGFLPVPRWTADRLNWSERIVYAWLVYRAELSLDQATCEDSAAKVAKSLGITKRSVFNALDGLVAKGLIERTADLPGEVGKSRFTRPPVNDPPQREGDEKRASTPVKKWPLGSENLASPSSKKLIKNSGQKNRNADQKCVDAREITATARDLFRRAGYSGADGGFLWKLAAMLYTGLVSDHEAHDCTNGARECRASNRPAFARTILRKHLERRGADLSEMLSRVRVTPELPTKPPEPPTRRPGKPQDARETVAGIFRRP